MFLQAHCNENETNSARGKTYTRDITNCMSLTLGRRGVTSQVEDGKP